MEDAGIALGIAAVAGVVALGSMTRARALLAVAAGCLAGFVAAGAQALAWLWLMAVLPVLAAAALLGWGLRTLLRRRAWLAPACVGVAALGLAAVLAARRAALDPVPAALAARLPHDTGALDTFCFPDISAADRRDAHRRLATLRRELPRRPDDTVMVRYTLAESAGDAREERTLRELAEETLQRGCASPEAAALRRALAAAG